MTHVYVIEVDDDSLHPYTVGATVDYQKARARVMELYPDAVAEGDDYSFRVGVYKRININVWELF